MSISRIKPTGWAINEKLTSAQMNQLDIDHANSLDKTIAGDTISGPITMSSTSSLTFNNGSDLNISGGVTITIDSGSNLISSGTWSLNGTITTTAAVLNIASNTQLNLISGSDLNAFSGTNVNLSGITTFFNGSQTTWNVGSTISVAGLLTQQLGTTWNLDGTVITRNITCFGTTRINVTSRQITRTVGSTGTTDYTAGVPNFNPSAGGVLIQTATTTGASIYYELDLPHNSTLTQAIVFIEPGPHGNLPASRPSLILTRTRLSDGAQFSTFEIDASGSIASYEALHLIIINTSLVIDRTQYRYTLRLIGEYGMFSLTGLICYGCATTSTITEYDEG